MHQDILDMQRTAGNRATASLIESIGHRGPVAIQRYQAGARGHGGIEADALGTHRSGGEEGAGLSGSMTSGEVGGAYLGNWMRDFSQIGNSRDPRVLQVLNILSMGEFGHHVTAEQVGGYLPSEHLDNPRGGGSVEDPGSHAGMTGLSTDQQAWVHEEQDLRSEFETRAAQTHVPAYIEVGKEHARREFLEAATGHRRDLTAEEAVGNALHTIEDYFAHSNFTDACIYMLARDGAIPATSPVLQGLQHRAAPQAQGGLGYDPSGGVAGGAAQPEIMTGTYRSTGNQMVSILEQIRSELETGALREAAARGAVRMAQDGTLNLNVLVSDPDLATALTRWEQGGAAVGAVGGAASGAAHGAAEGWERGHGIVGSVAGAAREAWRQGSSGGHAGAQAGIERAQAMVVQSLVGTIDAIIQSLLSDNSDRQTADLALDLGGQASTNRATANDRAAHDQAPNHSQLAKDDVDHPAFAASRALAVTVDRELGRQMIEVWNEREQSPEAVQAIRNVLAAHRRIEITDVPETLPALRQLLTLIDTYISNPADHDWWHEPLLLALGSSPGH